MAEYAEGAHRNWLSEQVAGVILAGGKSSRMGGQDKAFLTVDGETIFERTLRTLAACFPQVIGVSNTPEKFSRFDVPVIRDEFPHQGPLAGIHAALGWITVPYAFVVACDMPFVRAEPIAYLVSRIRSQDAIIPEWESDIEPLHGLYAARLRAPIEDALRAGTRAIREILPLLEVEFVSEQSLRRVHGAEESFRNINTPEEAARFDVHAHRRSARPLIDGKTRGL